MVLLNFEWYSVCFDSGKNRLMLVTNIKQFFYRTKAHVIPAEIQQYHTSLILIYANKKKHKH